MNNLLPCPFCGSANVDPEGWASTDRAGPACDDCGASADTVALWNARPEVERLREERRKWQEASVADREEAHRLRAALREVADGYDGGEVAATQLKDIARNAVEQLGRQEG